MIARKYCVEQRKRVMDGLAKEESEVKMVKSCVVNRMSWKGSAV